MANPAKAAQRVASLSRAGIHNRATEQLWHDLSIFEETTGKELGGSTGLLPPKNLTENERVVYDAIIEQFLEDPTSTVKGVRTEFKKVQKVREEARRQYLESKISANTKNQELVQKSVDRLMDQWKKENEKRIANFSKSDMAKDVDIYERMQKEVAIKEMIGSEQYKNMWTLSQAQNIKYEDMLEALYQVTVASEEDSISISELLGSPDIGSSLSRPGAKLTDSRSISLITGENDYMNDIEAPTDWQSTAQLEDDVLRYLKEVMEVSR